MAKIMVVDDDAACADLLKELLSESGHIVEAFEGSSAAFARAERFQPEVLVCDWRLRGEAGGLALARSIQQAVRNLRIVFVSGLPVDELEPKINSLPRACALQKPIDLDKLLAVIGDKPETRTT